MDENTKIEIHDQDELAAYINNVTDIFWKLNDKVTMLDARLSALINNMNLSNTEFEIIERRTQEIFNELKSAQ